MPTRKRKTVMVCAIKERINQMIDARGGTVEGRKALAVFLSDLLQDTGNYKGFTLTEWSRGGYTRWIAEGEPGFPKKTAYFGDESIVHFI